MSASIIINNRVVLKTSSGMIETLYYELEEILVSKNIFLNQEMISFMKFLEEQKISCSYIYLDEYIKTSQSVETLLFLLEVVIDKLKSYPKLTINSLWKFYGELMAYGEQLADEGK